MTALVQVLSKLTGTDIEIESLQAVLTFCGIGLLVSLLAIEAFGFDLVAGSF
jgi:hypothetical protein